MARADLIVGLVKAARAHDDATLRRTVEALAAEERGKQHHVLAERLEEALRTNGGPRTPPTLVSETPTAGVEVGTPERTLDEMVLPDEVRRACLELVEEQHRAEVLRSHGLEPRHRILLVGPPGNGKTTLAEAIADGLYVPFVRVRYETVIASYLGETAARLGKVFEFARTRPCVLFFDEFDVVAKERGDEHETGEIKRVVSSLLLQIDALPSYVVVVGASNHPELLDRAASRRFELMLTLPPPSAAARREWFERFFGRFDVPPPKSPDALARRTSGASFSDLEELGLDIMRRCLLHPDADPKSLMAERLKDWQPARTEVDA